MSTEEMEQEEGVVMDDQEFLSALEQLKASEDDDVAELLKMMNENRIISWEEAEQILGDTNQIVKSSLPEQTRPTEPDNDTNVDRCIQQLNDNDPNLKAINLNNMKRTPIPQIKRLVEAVAYNTELESLSLANLGLYDNSLESLPAVLELNTTLKKLNLETNYLSGEFFSKVFKAACVNQTLEEVKAVNQGISFATTAEKEIIDNITANRGLIKVSVNLRLPEGRHKIENSTLRNGEIKRILRREAIAREKAEAEQAAKKPAEKPKEPIKPKPAPPKAAAVPPKPAPSATKKVEPPMKKKEEEKKEPLPYIRRTPSQTTSFSNIATTDPTKERTKAIAERLAKKNATEEEKKQPLVKAKKEENGEEKKVDNGEKTVKKSMIGTKKEIEKKEENGEEKKVVKNVGKKENGEEKQKIAPTIKKEPVKNEGEKKEERPKTAIKKTVKEEEKKEPEASTAKKEEPPKIPKKVGHGKKEEEKKEDASTVNSEEPPKVPKKIGLTKKEEEKKEEHSIGKKEEAPKVPKKTGLSKKEEEKKDEPSTVKKEEKAVPKKIGVTKKEEVKKVEVDKDPLKALRTRLAKKKEEEGKKGGEDLGKTKDEEPKEGDEAKKEGAVGKKKEEEAKKEGDEVGKKMESEDDYLRTRPKRRPSNLKEPEVKDVKEDKPMAVYKLKRESRDLGQPKAVEKGGAAPTKPGTRAF